MISSEQISILKKFREKEKSRAKAPVKEQSRRSSNRFLGHVFASVMMESIERSIPKGKYQPVIGPIWIEGLEWIEWDGALIKKGSDEKLFHYYSPEAIAAIFEFKTAGIYGVKEPQKGKKTMQDVIKSIKDNFNEAQKYCGNIGCFYVSLFERKPNPSNRNPINYYKETKDNFGSITTCVLFNGRDHKKDDPEPLDSWNEFISEVKASLK